MNVRIVRRLPFAMVAVASMLALGVSTASAASAAIKVTGVTFSGTSGTSTSPTVTIVGTGFGGAPAGTSDNVNSCSTYTNNGKVYGTKFYFVEDTNNWEAGRSTATGKDCIGIIIVSWTSTKIVFQFGNAFGSFDDWHVRNGDNYVIVIKGYLWGGVVSGLS